MALWASATQLSSLYGATNPLLAHGAPAIRPLSALAAGIWLIRTLRTASRWQAYLALPVITAACLAPLLPSLAGRAVFNLAFSALAAWLTLNLLHRHGTPPRRVLHSGQREPRPAGLVKWIVAGGGMYVASALTVYYSGWLAYWWPDLVPARSQDEVLGWSGTLHPVSNVVYTCVLEELVIVATVVILTRAARLPLWTAYAISIGLRVATHLFIGAPALAAILLGAAGVGLYLRTRRLLPLMLGHFLYDTLPFLQEAW
ncbi:type II CAAX prenyl endopeptidase Rce1 family protein [Streptomyces roseifaciens]|uniref:CPBP family glutamic-type intramembrane protease n=1 Tax=Streptomyces roseifaciens TaxID=1488406 RepID=UPI000AB66879